MILFSASMSEEIISCHTGHDSLRLSGPSLSSPSSSWGWYQCCCCFNSSSREVSHQTSTRYLTAPPTSPNYPINLSAEADTICITPPTSPDSPIDLSAEADTIVPPTSPTPTIRSEARADVSEFVEEPWYHADISWKVAEERLNALGSDCYLVRKSQSEEGKYILSVRYGGVIKHHPICVQDERYEVEGTKKQFSTLKQLIAYYKQRHLSTEWEKLVTPCSPPRLTPSKEKSPPIMSKH